MAFAECFVPLGRSGGRNTASTRAISGVKSPLFLRFRAVSNAIALLRVVLLAAAILVVSLIFFARSAAAAMGDALRSFGEKMMLEYPGAEYRSRPRVLSVNGVDVHLVTAFVAADIGSVLDHFETSCSERTGILDEERALAKLRVAARHPRETFPLLRGVARSETATEGVVACLDTQGRLSIAELTGRLERFTKSGDLGEIGGLRYVLAKKNGRGTSLLLLWTEGRTPLFGMFPPTGDCPGSEPVDVPKPPRLRRVLSAAEHGMPFGIAVYVTRDQSVPELERFYRDELPKRGFSIEQEKRSGPARATLTVRSRQRAMFIVLSRGAKGESVVSVETLA